MDEREKIKEILKDSNYSVNVYHDQDTGDLYIYDGNSYMKIGNRPTEDSSKKDSIEGTDAVSAPADDDETFAREMEERRKQLEKERQEAQEAKDRGEEYDPEALLPDETEEDVAKRVAEIQKIYDDEEAMGSLKKETEEKVRRYGQRTRKAAKGAEQNFSSKNMEFQMDLEQFIKGQIKNRRNRTWQKPHMGYEGTGIFRQGHRSEREKTIPRINVYFDQSGSWGENDVKIGQELIGVLNEYVDRHLLDIEVFYFANHVSTTNDEDEIGRGTRAGAEIVYHILETTPDNVIIMTDDDIDENGHWNQIKDAPKVKVPGGRWCLFRQTASPTIEKWIQGERHNSTYMI